MPHKRKFELTACNEAHKIFCKRDIAVLPTNKIDWERALSDI